MNCYTEHMDNNLLYSLPRLERQIATTTRTNDEVEDEDDEPPTVMPVLRRQIADMTVV